MGYMNRIIHFEIHADDPERVATFYRKIFGWDIKKWDSKEMEYWMVMTAPQDSKEPGINGGLLRRGASISPTSPTQKSDQQANAFVCTILVDDIDATIAALKKEGSVECMPKFAIANMAWQAYYKDTEGNTFGIHQPFPGMLNK